MGKAGAPVSIGDSRYLGYLLSLLLLPAPLPIAGLVAVPDIVAPDVLLERRLVLLAVAGRWVLGFEFADGVSRIPVPTRPGKKGS